MRVQPLSPDRAIRGSVSVNLDQFVKDLASATGFELENDSIDPGPIPGSARSGGDTARFAVSYLFENIISKFDDACAETDSLKTSKALEKFREAEAMCATTNSRFESFFYGHRPVRPDVSSVLVIARDKIWRLLEGMTLDEIASGFTFTGGASFGLAKTHSSPAHKYSTKVETTCNAELAVQCAMRVVPLWGGYTGSSETVLVPGNKLNCVPKNYKVHRLIAQEPSGNMYLQKGLGAALRRRLRTVGVDLGNQKTNQDFALLGSKTGLVATVDMSMASDTVAKTVVEWFLPPEIYRFANAIRSHSGVLPSGETVLYRKFSSMGNAATFELETLIFWGLAMACCKVGEADGRFVAVYGDDVIIPTSCVELFLDVLKECGFKPNPEKSFWDGEDQIHGFRESCGKHYLNGEDVTPFFIKTQIVDLLDLFLLVNNLERWRRRMALIDGTELIDRKVRELIVSLRSNAPDAWMKPRIPDGKGDGAFIGTFDEVCPSRIQSRKRLWFEGWTAEVLTRRPKTTKRIDGDGYRLLSRKRDKGERVWHLYDGKRYRKTLRSLTLRGYTLSRLREMEVRPLTFVQVSNGRGSYDLADYARSLASFDYGEEPAGLILDPVGEVCVTSLVILQFDDA